MPFIQLAFMKLIVQLIILILIATSSFSQNRINKFSLDGFDNFYSLNSNQGYNNDVVRHGDGLSIGFKTYDTLKKRGMIYELIVNNTNAYYENIFGIGGILNVENTFVSANFIFPVLLFHRAGMEQTFSAGLCISTLGARDYYNSNNNLLSYNETTLKNVPFGKYWTSALILDYDFNFKIYKKIGFNIGIRYTAASPVNSSKIDYNASLGNSLGVKYGIHYQF